MKRWLVVAVAMGLALAAVMVVRGLMGDATYMSWRDSTEFNIRNLAMFIEVYREEHGKYPSSISNLLDGVDPPGKNFVPPLLDGRSHGTYAYRCSTNAFVITVQRPARWLMKGETMERKYAVGEALKQFDPQN
jgi:type II secretory pathway pseudopilin PulG